MIKDWDPKTGALLRRLDGKGILIVGDSWTQGEFEMYNHGAQSHVVVHRGLSQYLMDDGHRVHNRGEGGLSNIESYWRLKSAFGLHDNDEFGKPIEDPIDYIIWITTDSFRDTNDENKIIEKIKQENSIGTVMFGMLFEKYLEMNELSKQIGIPIHCIGGWTPLLKDMEPFDNLVPLIPCVHELLVPGSNLPITHNALHRHKFIRNLGWISDKIKQEIIELIDQWTYSQEIRRNHPDLFFPDWEHPNRLGHYKIYETVKEKLGLL